MNPFANQQEVLMSTAYGLTGLGMPRLGLPENVSNINAELL